jgi:hypothetical protein
MGRPREAHYRTRATAEARAVEHFGEETWAAMKYVREARPGWAWMLRLIPQFYEAEARVADLLDKALPPLKEARRVAHRALLEIHADRGELPVMWPGSLNSLSTLVDRLAKEVEQTVADTRQRVERETRRDDFKANRFKKARRPEQARESRAGFINAVLDSLPNVQTGGAKWVYAAIALGFEDPTDDADVFEKMTREWAAELRRVRKQRQRPSRFPR